MRSKVEKILAGPNQFLGKVSVLQLWKVLIGIAVVIATAFTGLTGYRMFQYFRLGTSAPAIVTQWGVRELSSSQFAMEASFEFEAAGQRFYGKTLFDPPIYLNPFSAKEAINARKTEAFTVWFQSSNPSVCSLQKEFPLKSLMHALVAIGVVTYFAFVSKKIISKIMEVI